MRLRLLVAPLLALAARDLQAEVAVRLVGDRVTVRAEAAPLSEVLERLAQRTGMKVVWERNLGRPDVTASLENCTQAEAVLGLLQGSGFNYALTLDPTGARVEVLMIVGVAGHAPGPGALRPARPEPREPVEEPSIAEVEEPNAEEAAVPTPRPRPIAPSSRPAPPRPKTP